MGNFAFLAYLKYINFIFCKFGIFGLGVRSDWLTRVREDSIREKMINI
jgi:hypothetical protein